MVLLLPLILALSADPSPAAPSKLQEIGRVQSLPACTTIVVRANSAISEALSNDSTLAILMTRPRNLDYDGASSNAKAQSISDLYEFAHRLRDAATAGDVQVKKLREIAAGAANPDRKRELKAFADALGGALRRQQLAGVDLDRAIAVYQGRSATGDDQLFIPSAERARPEPMQIQAHFNDTLRSLATDFTRQIDAIAADEGVAEDHSLGATMGC